MDFDCDFNDLNFCQYSNLGWGFQKSVINTHVVKPISNLPFNANYFPCSVSNNFKDGSRLEKKIPLNTSHSLCLQFAYMLDEGGEISVTNGQNKWSKNATIPYSHWHQMRFPINLLKLEPLSDISSDSSIFKISGQLVCVDNFTVSSHACPLTSTTFDNNLSSSPSLWLTQPFSVLVAILTVLVLFLLVGLFASVLCAKKSQRALHRSRQLSRKLKRSSFQCSIDNGSVINSCCDIDTIGSNRFFAHPNRFLPIMANMRNNSQRVRYSQQSFAASSSVETNNNSTPHYRFSLALTEDAQVQLLTNSSAPNKDCISHYLTDNQSLLRQQSLLTTLSHESSPSPNEINGNNQQPISVSTVPLLCPPIIDQSESDLSLDLEPISEQTPIKCNRHRPIRESMNIGYVSDTSLCYLPQYDLALQLLAEQSISGNQSPDSDGTINNSDIMEL